MRKFTTAADRIVRVHVPRVLVETAVARGVDRRALFEGTDLTPEMFTNPDMRISYLQFGILCRNALQLTGDPALGLEVGRNTGLAQIGMPGFLLQQSATVRAALEASIRYTMVHAPTWEFGLVEKPPLATLTIAEGVSMGAFRPFSYDLVLAAFDTQARSLTKRAIPVRRLRLPFPEPPYADEYRKRFYDVPIEFDHKIASVDFDAAFLDETIAFADPAAAKLAEQVLAQEVPLGSGSDGLVSQVRRLLASATGTPPTLDELARALQTSTRSLRRELGSMHTSYKELLDETRRLRAQEWVATNSMPLERLATLLGFSHVRSFRRAFKRWTGRTPSSARTRVH